VDTDNHASAIFALKDGLEDNMKILIADDDQVIRDGLIRRIPWAEHGHEIVAVASDGKEAYELALKYCPQIILSDIEMPYMNGLDLAGKLKEVLEHCRIIFLTGYDDFAYIRQALKLDVVDYILKIDPDEVILEAVAKAEQELTASKQMAGLSGWGKMMLRQKMAAELLSSDTPPETLEDNARQLGLHLTERSYLVAVIRTIDNKRQLPPADQATRAERLLAGFQGLAEPECFFIRHQGYFAAILPVPENAQDDEHSCDDWLQQLLIAVQEKTSILVQAGVGRPCRSAKDFEGGFNDAVFAVEGSRDDSLVSHYEELSQNQSIRKIREYVLEHYGEPELSLLSISQYMHLTPAYISGLFKRYSGENFKNYVIRIRIERACELLNTTELCTYEVAERVGYPNSQYFSVMFKKIMGCSPSVYRQNNNKSIQKY